MRLCPPLLFSFFRLLRRGGYRGNIGLLYCGVERGEILGLDFMPGSQLRFETRIEFVEHGVGCGGRRAVRAFNGFLQICELVGYLNRKIQRVLAALGFRLNDLLFDGVHFFIKGIDGFEEWLCAGVRRETFFQGIELAANAANLIHRFVPCAYATAYAQRELLLFLKIGLRCGDARVFGEFDAGGGSFSSDSEFDLVSARSHKRALGATAPANRTRNGGRCIVLQIPNEAIQADFYWKLLPGSADAELLFIGRSAGRGFFARILAN